MSDSQQVPSIESPVTTVGAKTLDTIDDELMYFGGGRGSMIRYTPVKVKALKPVKKAPAETEDANNRTGLFAGLKKSVAALFSKSTAAAQQPAVIVAPL